MSSASQERLDASRQDAIDAVYHLYDPPLWVLTAADGARRGGLVATFVVRASIVPSLPRMVVGIAKHHHTWELIESSGGFVLHLLGEQQRELIWRFGLQSGRETDKLASLPIETTPGGQPRLADALAWLDCRVETRLDSGDRTVYVAAVVDGGTTAEANPLTIKGFFQSVSPEQRATLDRLLAEDSALDAEAILAWRASAFGAGPIVPPLQRPSGASE